MAALFVLDMLTGDDTVFVPGYVLAPLLVAFAAGARPTAAVGVAATALGLVGLLQDGDFEAQDAIRLATVAAGSALAVAIAALRTRLQRANIELGEALGLLDVVFAHAPVGIALLIATCASCASTTGSRRSAVSPRTTIEGARSARSSRGCRPRWSRTRRGSRARGRR